MRVRPFLELPLFLAVIGVGSARAAEPLFADGSRILFLGDSITQDGKYIALIDAYLLAEAPDREVETVNLGVSSETASGLSEADHPFPRPCIHDRLDRILALGAPDVTFVCYGMNDAIYHPLSDERFKAYKDGVTSLVEKVAATGSRVILLTPPPFDAESTESDLQPEGRDDYGYKKPFRGYSDVLATYGKWVMEQAARDDVEAAVDLYGPLDGFIRDRRAQDPGFRYGDGVHPSEDGHLVMAQAILRATEGEEAAQKAAALAQDGEFWDKVQQRHKIRSQAFREFVGFSQLKDRSAVGDREKLDARLDEAGDIEAELERVHF